MLARARLCQKASAIYTRQTPSAAFHRRPEVDKIVAFPKNALISWRRICNIQTGGVKSDPHSLDDSGGAYSGNDLRDYKALPFKRAKKIGSSFTVNGRLQSVAVPYGRFSLSLLEYGPGDNYSNVLLEEGRGFFDRTSYILKLEQHHPSLILFRPPHFGKSHVVGMLEHFHDFYNRSKHTWFYEGLDDVAREALDADNRDTFRRLSGELRTNFHRFDESQDSGGSQSAWRCLREYSRRPTFSAEKPASWLRIPNIGAVRHFADTSALTTPKDSPLKLFQTDGDIRHLLRSYQDLMLEKDQTEKQLEKGESYHVQRFRNEILGNGFDEEAEFRVTKPNKTKGSVDLIISSRSHLIVTEWKIRRVEFLGIQRPNTCSKAKKLEGYTLWELLRIRFSRKDKFHRGKTMREFIEDDVAPQLRSYVLSDEVKKLAKEKGLALQAYVIVVVGSRHILMCEMGEDGRLSDRFECVKATGKQKKGPTSKRKS